MISLKNRLFIAYSAAIIVALLLFSCILYASFNRIFIHELDDFLLTSAKTFAAIIDGEPNENDQQDEQGEHSDEGNNNNEIDQLDEVRIEMELHQNLPAEFMMQSNNAYFCIFKNDKVVVKSPSFKQSMLNFELKFSPNPQYISYSLPSGENFRAVYFQFNISTKEQNQSSLPLGIIVGRNTHSIENYLSKLRLIILGCGFFVILIGFLLSGFLSKAGLKPISSLADNIAAIDDKNISSERIDCKLPSELIPIATCLNSLLERISASILREKRISGDIAHELRTPIAGIKTSIEVTLNRPREKEEYKETLEQCLEISNHLEAMISSLLSIARIENGKITIAKENVNLKEIIGNYASIFDEITKEKNIEVCFDLQEPNCQANSDLLMMLILNLLDNAFEYVDDGGNITVRSFKNNGKTAISFSNSGSILTPEQLPCIFEIFWRGENSRTGTENHSGIGLAVVQKAAIAMGAEIEASLPKDGIFEITIIL